MPVEPTPVKTPRARVAKGKTAKRSQRSKTMVTKRAPPVVENDSGGEDFDIRGFTDLDDSESDLERRS